MKTLASELFVILSLASTWALANDTPSTVQAVAAVGSAPASAAAAAMAEEPPKPVAPRVYEGDADCDLKERVSVRAVLNEPGIYEVRHRKARYRMLVEPTHTGAVKLRDARAGVVWLQIPSTSMLLNDKIGQRVASNCLSAEQLHNNANEKPDPTSALGIEKKEIQ